MLRRSKSRRVDTDPLACNGANGSLFEEIANTRLGTPVVGDHEALDKHPLFRRILLHSDTELTRIFDAGIRERETIHQWPLSCVQRLLLDDGRKFVYKSQLPPTVEPQFYASVSSALLPGYRYLGKFSDCEIMLIHWVDAPLLREAAHTDIELLGHAKQLIAQIGTIPAEAPVYLNLAREGVWLATLDATLGKLRRLLQTRRFAQLDMQAVDTVSEWACSPAVVQTVMSQSRFIHGDLNAGQVFLTEDGYRVIDWQRPMIAPPDVDLVSLLVSERIDPHKYVDPAIVGVYWFLFLHWSVQAQCDLLPEFRGDLFDRWSSTAVAQIIRSKRAFAFRRS